MRRSRFKVLTAVSPRSFISPVISGIKLSIFSLVFMAAACPPGPSLTQPAYDSGVSDAPVSADDVLDDVLIVDCLLPGQVRRIGLKSTYITPRRPVKTTGIDCAICGSATGGSILQLRAFTL